MSIAIDGTMQQNTSYRPRVLAACLAATMAISGAALPAVAQQAAPTEFSEQELAAFAAANHQIQELRQEWMPRIQQAETTDENVQMRQRATEEMAAAVRDEGLTVEQYNEIANAAQNNPEVMRQVEEHLQSPQ